jgi:hypothetical protein
MLLSIVLGLVLIGPVDSPSNQTNSAAKTELMFEGDSRLTEQNRGEFEKAGFIIAKATRGEDGVWHCECDVVMGEPT